MTPAAYHQQATVDAQRRSSRPRRAW
jgi:hypothetical protein